MITDNFTERHNGPRTAEEHKMLEIIGAGSLQQLMDETIPASIRLEKPLDIPAGISEYELIHHLRELGSRNQLWKTFIGMGYYNTITPGVVVRNILENPGWYTSYTPYQAEISQGRLEALLNYQTMVSDLTGMPMANASLLDEGTAAAEAMIMSFNARPRSKVKAGSNKFFVDQRVFAHTIDVMHTRAVPLGIELVTGDFQNPGFDDAFFGALVQYPDQYGNIHDYSAFAGLAHQLELVVAAAADLLSLTLLTPPGEWGADVVVGTTQRFGIPLGYGGPHAAYFATREDFKRYMPGRIIGVSVDADGNRALRMALQTREQHIKRERATSNICTAQALLANMAGFYAAWHGPEGLKKIARHINILTGVLADEVKKYGYAQLNTAFFDTVRIEIPAGTTAETVKSLAQKHQVNFRYISDHQIGISLDETTHLNDVNLILSVLAEAAGKVFTPFVCVPEVCGLITTFPSSFNRTTPYLTHPVFNTYHSETEMMRYMKKLENRDLGLNRTMIPLGSCTMKLNAASEMFALSWPEFGSLHPFVPVEQADGYMQLIRNLEKDLCTITGFEAVSFMPNSGASGEYTGLLVIMAYLKSIGQVQRNICLIPSSAHGTNPASAVMAGMQVVVVNCDEQGNIDLNDLRAKAEQYKDTLAAIMVTYPSTHGVYEEGILELTSIVHQHGGQVYMDGANMNAQVGFTNPARIGADVCHLNLHKTFAIPHGGGGPGVGPIGVASHLVPFLPGHRVVKTGGNRANSAVSSAPFGSSLILTISYAYIKLLGGEGLKKATEYAILTANYLKSALEKDYKILYTNHNGRVAHEFILDCHDFKRTAEVEVIDIAKRLMDYGFHAPTVAFPVHGTLMVEPTESEPLNELDRFVTAMKQIRTEIAEIENGQSDKHNNPVKNAPHTLAMVTSNEWNLPYPREKAAFPVPFVLTDKYFTPVRRIDDAYGDRNLVCACEPVDSYR
ncbi:MAG TPA: aminomethyl-transferring glycine dehydrogenase [Bacteroidales bacterium]|nr:aminomethyl-transferring glycine dehydrogenase [Bacteroidales bacterium]